MNKLLVGLLGWIILLCCKTKIANAQPINEVTQRKSPTARIIFTPLAEQLFTQPTAKHLGRGEVSINLHTRSFFFPDLVADAVDNDDTAVNFNTGFSWGINDDLQLTLQFQHVDSSSPVKQGDFTSERTEDNEAALELKQRIWSNQAETQALSGVFAASWGTRGFKFSQGGESTEINNRDIFVSLAVPFTTDVGEWQFNISPTVAFFRDESAVFFRRLPNDNDSSFGTVLGLGGGVSYEINPKLLIFSDVFLPLTGNNSINRDSGEPDKAIAYNAGLRFLTNPRLALDIYATNASASFAPLSLTADRDFVGVGANLVFMPDIFAANRRIPDSFRDTGNKNTEVFTTDGIAFFDGGTVPSGKLSLQLQGGSQGVLTAIRYGVLKDFEAGIFLDYIAGEIDESEQGISGKIRFLNQAENAPFTLSIAGTASLTNEPFVNFFENDADAFENSGLDKSVPIFTPGGDDAATGKRLILTFALPLHYKINDDAAVWLTPIVGYVQRQNIETGGFNLGGALAVSSEISFTGEVGANFIGEGNGLIDGQREDAIPWTVGVRWTPLSLLGIKPRIDNGDPHLELYLTNRVGSSTWHQLRVRESNTVGVGAGLFFPL